MMMMIRAWLLALTVATWAHGAQAAERFDVAILGDSLSTGAATHPHLAFDTGILWQVFNGDVLVVANAEDIPEAGRFKLSGTLPPPVRLWPTAREFTGGFDWVFLNAMTGLSRLYLDTEQYSWGYMVGMKLASSPRRIALAAQNGARTAQIPRQIDRVLDATDGALPPKVFLFFTGNDLCGPTLDYLPDAEAYGRTLERSLSYILRNGTPAPSGTDVYVPAFLGVLQLLHSDSILNKKIEAFGKEITCRELRENGYRPKDPGYDPKLPPEAAYFGLMMPPNPAAYCPTLFGKIPGRDAETAIGELANRIRSFRDEQRRVVSEMDERARKMGVAIRFHFLPTTGDLIFGGDDVAADCFHLSPKGQGRVADAVLQDLSRIRDSAP